MELVAAALIAVVTFGVPLGLVAWGLSSRPWQLPLQIFVLCLAAIVWWLPAMLLGGGVSELLPLDWGHASIGYFVGYFVGSIPAAAIVIERFVSIARRGRRP